MKKLLSMAVAAFLLSAGIASAGTISDPLFSNGDTTIDASGNSTVTGAYTLQVGPNEVCEVVRTQAAPQAFTDVQVGGSLGYQQGTYTGVPFSVKVSPNTGTYFPTVQCAGIWGGNHSVDGADNVVATANLGTIRVTAQGSTSVGSGSLSQWDVIMQSLQAILARMTATSTASATLPTVSVACSNLAEALVGTSQGVNNDANASLQGFLVSPLGGRQSIPALKAGAAFGFYGTQTAKAVSTFKLQNSC